MSPSREPRDSWKTYSRGLLVVAYVLWFHMQYMSMLPDILNCNLYVQGPYSLDVYGIGYFKYMSLRMRRLDALQAASGLLVLSRLMLNTQQERRQT